MAEHLNREQVADMATIYAEPVLRNATIVDRNFELPGILYGLTVGLFMAFLAMTGIAFANPELIIPMVMFAVSILAGFGLAAKWAHMHPDNPTRSLTWNQFLRSGIQVQTGQLSASEASVQVLLLPVLIFVWGVAAVTIAALV